MAVKASKFPRIRIQDSAYEVITSARDGPSADEEFWVEIDSHEVRFRASQEHKLQSSQEAYNALVTPSAMQLDLYRNSQPLGTVRFGNMRLSFPKSPGRITCGDVFGSRAIAGDDNGNLRLLNLNSSENNITSWGGHLLHTSVAKFFPSGKVALSAGMDFSIKIWDLDTNSLAQSLVHQKGMIDDVAIIGRGRNLLSLCSKTEDVILWEVGKAQVLRKYEFPGANCLAVWKNGAMAPDPTNAAENGSLFEVDGKLGVVGANNSVVCFDLRAPSSECTTVLNEGAEKICLFGDMLLRSNANVFTVHDMRMPQNKLAEIESLDGSITNLAATSSKAYVKTSLYSWGYELSAGQFEIICGEDTSIPVVHNEELWEIGNDGIRNYPL